MGATGFFLARREPAGRILPSNSRYSEPAIFPPVIRTDGIAAESSVPVPFPYMDGYEWQSLRNGFGPSAAVAMGPDHLLTVENKFKHYIDDYRRHFHPFFPIVQYSALISAPPPPLLALLMVMIGAQFSNLPASKNYSTFLYELCVGLRSTVRQSHSIFSCDSMLMT